MCFYQSGNKIVFICPQFTGTCSAICYYYSQYIVHVSTFIPYYFLLISARNCFGFRLAHFAFLVVSFFCALKAFSCHTTLLFFDRRTRGTRLASTKHLHTHFYSCAIMIDTERDNHLNRINCLQLYSIDNDNELFSMQKCLHL